MTDNKNRMKRTQSHQREQRETILFILSFYRNVIIVRAIDNKRITNRKTTERELIA